MPVNQVKAIPPHQFRPARQRRGLWLAAAGLVGAGAVWAVAAMLQHPVETEAVRDVFIILMALAGLVMGTALLVLMVQLARLTLLIRHEIRPILAATDEAVRALRGTTTFLSTSVVHPVIRAHGSAAALKRALSALRLSRRG